MTLEIVYDDGDLIAVNKPAGLVVHRSNYVGPSEAYLVDLLREQLGGSISLAHRLDRATSGLLLATRSSAMAAAMGEQFMDREVRKQYLAVCRGWPDPAEGEVDYPLPGARETGPRREARTGYRKLGEIEVPIALGRYPQQRYALVLASPHTGRFHQIRKHLAHIHHPIIGDSQHGRGDHNRLYKQYFQCHRMLLHAWRLQFRHPLSQQLIELEAPLDAEFSAILQRFEWSLPAVTMTPCLPSADPSISPNPSSSNAS